MQISYDWSENLANRESNTLSLDFFHQPLLFRPLVQESILNRDNSQTLLGQVFTPNVLASFMVSLIDTNSDSNCSILDPCIGPNTFLNYFDDANYSIKLTGIELDKNLITESIRNFYCKPNRTLIIDSFFNLQLSEKFDFIIENPPYVRQELMMEGENSKSILLNEFPILSKKVPSKSNLYVYFLIKSIFHLNDGGRLIAVIYDSWLYSDFGKFLKEMFVQFGSIEAIYHFKKNAFPDAEVGATVIDFKRITKEEEKKKFIRIFKFKNVNEIGDKFDKNVPDKKISISEFLAHRFNEDTILDFSGHFFTPIKEISNQQIERGTSSIANKYFINQEKKFEESVPFVKDVTSINSFCVDKETHYLLTINGNITERTKKYIDFVKDEILNTPEKFSSLKRDILADKIWYKVKLKKTGNIIFNYYLRKNIDFLLNENLSFCSDNFYVLKIDENLLANFALLNSTFTKIAILLNSRNQGNGLRKIQLYEFNEIPVVNLKKLSDESIVKLTILGEQLKSVSRYCENKGSFLKEIDKILLEEYNMQNKTQISIEDFYKDFQNIFLMN